MRTYKTTYTKHYYIEGERICSKIGSGFQGAYIPPTSTPIDFIAGSAHIYSRDLIEMVGRNVQCARYNGGIDINPYLPPAHNDGNEYEKLQYFYHSDHLGSASFVTNIDGYVMQHLQYFPYGELFVSQRNTEFDSRYKFTAKELDNETSYTYFGARYYDSELSGWLSVDPMSDKYPSLSPYCYSADNPVVLVDPNGMEFDEATDKYVQKLENEISMRLKVYNDRMEKLDISSKKYGEYQKQVNEYNKILGEISELRNDKDNIYTMNFGVNINSDGEFKYAGQNESGQNVFNINIKQSSEILAWTFDEMAHELKHAYQYYEGKLGFAIAQNGSQYNTNNSRDLEVQAKFRGDLFFGNTMTHNKTFKLIQPLYDPGIDPDYVNLPSQYDGLPTYYYKEQFIYNMNKDCPNCKILFNK